MHACGHDLHMSAWYGTAKLMAENRKAWSGTLMLIGQPSEETVHGAEAMLKDGLFKRFPKPDYALSFHDDATMPSGTIMYHAGAFRASSDVVNITVFGQGGHGAVPHEARDPIVIAARLVLALQTLVSRENNPIDPPSSPSAASRAAPSPTSFPTRSRCRCRCAPSSRKCASASWPVSRAKPRARRWPPARRRNRWSTSSRARIRSTTTRS
jgi:metal-dependent amidase/aminoacylase/carboxypeptidase family protein